MISFVPGAEYLAAVPGSTVNQGAVDRWTLLHLAVGAAAGAIGMPLGVFAALSVGYEVFEQFYERDSNNAFGTSKPESALNVAADFAANGIGWYAGSRIARRR